MPSGERRIRLRYGETGLELKLSPDWDVTAIRKPAMPVVADPAAALRAALEAPVGAAPLGEAGENAASACIVICDSTRPVPNGLLLPPLVDALTAAGLADDEIQILVASGLHDPLSERELDALVGHEGVRRRIRVHNHIATDEPAHLSLGATASGTPILIDRRFVEAGLRIVVGLVEPHFMAGYSGGRKLVVPGVAAHETIARVHAHRIMADPLAANCVIEGNPLHREQLEAVAKVGTVHAVNTVLDEARRLSFLNFGEIVESHAEAVAFVRPYAEVPVTRPFKTVVTTGAGAPLDNSYYQTIKGMVAAIDALAPGGRMFVASACRQGFGSAQFLAAQQRLVNRGVDGFLRELAAKDQADIDEWQTQLLTAPLQKGSIALYTEALDDEQRTWTGVEPVDDLQAALDSWMRSCGDPRVAVIPEGPYVIPRLVSSAGGGA